MMHMRIRPFHFICLTIAVLVFFGLVWYRLLANSPGDLQVLGIQIANEEVAVELVGTFHEDNANYLRVEVQSFSESPKVIALDVRRESTLWYAGGSQLQFCLLLDRGDQKTVDIPFPMDHWKFYKNSETSVSIMVSGAEDAGMILQVLSAYDRHIPGWNFCFREPGMKMGDWIYQSKIPTDSLFGRFWDPKDHFNLYRSASFDVYAHKLSIANQHMDDIILRRETAFRQIKALFGAENDERLRLVFYPDDETKTNDTQHVGAGYAWRNNVVEIYNEETKLDDYHEIAHVVVGLIGSPPAMFNEGFAVYVSEKLGAPALEGFGYGDQTIDQVAKKLHEKGELLPIEELFAFWEIGSEASRWAVSYPQAASFTKFIIQSDGYEVFGKLLAELRNSVNPEVIAQNRERFREITGLGLEEQATRWMEYLEK